MDILINFQSTLKEYLIKYVSIFVDLFALHVLTVTAFILFLSLWVTIMPPPRHTLRTTKKVNAPLHRVWELMTDWSGQTEWRKDIRSVDFISKTRFIEYLTRNDEAIQVDIITLVPLKTIVLKMSCPSHNEDYRAELSEQDGTTLVTINKTVTEKSLLRRITARYFGIISFEELYFNQLNAYINPHTHTLNRDINQDGQDKRDCKAIKLTKLSFASIIIISCFIFVMTRTDDTSLVLKWIQLLFR